MGSSGVKLAVYDEGLARVFFERVGLPIGRDGRHDAQAVASAVRHLVLKAREEGARSVGVATYRASVLAWDREGRPLTAVATWLSPHSAELYARLPWYVKLAGKVPPLNIVIAPRSPALRFLQVLGEVEERRGSLEGVMAWTLDAFIAYSLTRRYVSDACNAALTGLVHPASFRPLGVVEALLSVRPVFPEIVDNTEPIGECEGVEVAALTADQQAACVGDACVEEGLVKVTNGSGTFVDVPTGDYRRVGGLLPVVLLRHRGVARYGLEGYLPTSGLAVELLRRVGVLADYGGLEVEPEAGPLFVPALAGLHLPNRPMAKGVIAGLDLNSGGRSFVSALLKGVAFHVKLAVERSGVKARAIRANGGLSRCNTLLRLISACVGVPVERQADFEATLRGLALLQMLGEGSISLSELEAKRREVEVFTGDGLEWVLGEYPRWLKLADSLKS